MCVWVCVCVCVCVYSALNLCGCTLLVRAGEIQGMQRGAYRMEWEREGGGSSTASMRNKQSRMTEDVCKIVG